MDSEGKIVMESIIQTKAPTGGFFAGLCILIKPTFDLQGELPSPFPFDETKIVNALFSKQPPCHAALAVTFSFGLELLAISVLRAQLSVDSGSATASSNATMREEALLSGSTTGSSLSAEFTSRLTEGKW